MVTLHGSFTVTDDLEVRCKFGMIIVGARFDVVGQDVRVICTSPSGVGQVSVEVALNGQQFTSDAVEFVYYDLSVNPNSFPNISRMTGSEEIVFGGSGILNSTYIHAKFRLLTNSFALTSEVLGTTSFVSSCLFLDNTSVQCDSPILNPTFYDQRTDPDVYFTFSLSLNAQQYSDDDLSAQILFYTPAFVDTVYPVTGPNDGDTIITLTGHFPDTGTVVARFESQFEVGIYSFVYCNRLGASQASCLSPAGLSASSLSVSVDVGSPEAAVFTTGTQFYFHSLTTEVIQLIPNLAPVLERLPFVAIVNATQFNFPLLSLSDLNVQVKMLGGSSIDTSDLAWYEMIVLRCDNTRGGDLSQVLISVSVNLTSLEATEEFSCAGMKFWDNDFVTELRHWYLNCSGELVDVLVLLPFVPAGEVYELYFSYRLFQSVPAPSESAIFPFFTSAQSTWYDDIFFSANPGSYNPGAGKIEVTSAAVTFPAGDASFLIAPRVPDALPVQSNGEIVLLGEWITACSEDQAADKFFVYFSRSDEAMFLPWNATAFGSFDLEILEWNPCIAIDPTITLRNFGVNPSQTSLILPTCDVGSSAVIEISKSAAGVKFAVKNCPPLMFPSTNSVVNGENLFVYFGASVPSAIPLRTFVWMAAFTRVHLSNEVYVDAALRRQLWRLDWFPPEPLMAPSATWIGDRDSVPIKFSWNGVDFTNSTESVSLFEWPTVTHCIPTTLPYSGGVILLEGSGFFSSPNIRIKVDDNDTVGNCVYLSPTRISCTVPPATWPTRDDFDENLRLPEKILYLSMNDAHAFSALSVTFRYYFLSSLSPDSGSSLDYCINKFNRTGAIGETSSVSTMILSSYMFLSGQILGDLSLVASETFSLWFEQDLTPIQAQFVVVYQAIIELSFQIPSKSVGKHAFQFSFSIDTYYFYSYNSLDWVMTPHSGPAPPARLTSATQSYIYFSGPSLILDLLESTEEPVVMFEEINGLYRSFLNENETDRTLVTSTERETVFYESGAFVQRVELAPNWNEIPFPPQSQPDQVPPLALFYQNALEVCLQVLYFSSDIQGAGIMPDQHIQKIKLSLSVYPVFHIYNFEVRYAFVDESQSTLDAAHEEQSFITVLEEDFISLSRFAENSVIFELDAPILWRNNTNVIFQFRHRNPTPFPLPYLNAGALSMRSTLLNRTVSIVDGSATAVPILPRMGLYGDHIELACGPKLIHEGDYALKIGLNGNDLHGPLLQDSTWIYSAYSNRVSVVALSPDVVVYSQPHPVTLSVDQLYGVSPLDLDLIRVKWTVNIGGYTYDLITSGTVQFPTSGAPFVTTLTPNVPGLIGNFIRVHF